MQAVLTTLGGAEPTGIWIELCWVGGACCVGGCWYCCGIGWYCCGGRACGACCIGACWYCCGIGWYCCGCGTCGAGCMVGCAPYWLERERNVIITYLEWFPNGSVIRFSFVLGGSSGIFSHSEPQVVSLSGSYGINYFRLYSKKTLTKLSMFRTTS